MTATYSGATNSSQQADMIKNIYRAIVKALHPDRNPGVGCPFLWIHNLLLLLLASEVQKGILSKNLMEEIRHGNYISNR